MISGNGLNGIRISSDSYDIQIENNFIGTNSLGVASLSNQANGVQIDSGASNITIGKPAYAARNTISGNAKAGILVSDAQTGSVNVYGNYIGTDLTGLFSVANGTDGVDLFEAGANNIGGIGSGNLISGNTGSGVVIAGNTLSNSVKDNFVGTNVSGAGPLMNTNGIVVTAINDPTLGVLPSQGNTIGGIEPNAANIISGNSNDGIQIDDGSTNTTIVANLIGADLSGKLPLKNGANGISINNSSFNDIGLPDPSSINTIANNGAAGILINSSTQTIVRNATITGNLCRNRNQGHRSKQQFTYSQYNQK